MTIDYSRQNLNWCRFDPLNTFSSARQKTTHCGRIPEHSAVLKLLCFLRRVIRVQISRHRKLHTILALELFFDMVAMGLASRFKSNGPYFFAKLVNLHVREYLGVDRVDI